MDPLSITASAITLIEAAAIVTKSLYEFGQALRTADSRLTSLSYELMHLTEFLKSVNKTLKDCRPFDLALVDDELWRQSDSALLHCQMTLSDLNSLIQKIKDGAGSARFGWRMKVVIDLSIHGNEIVAFRDRIHKSNWALQTILHTITVSLSLRNNAGQRLILDELERLKASISEALRVSCRPAGGFSHGGSSQSDARVARNLKDLANAAKVFYSAASSTASTSRGDVSETAWRSSSAAAMSLDGEFSPATRDMVERFVRDGYVQATKETNNTSSPISEPPISPVQPSYTDLGDKELDLEDEEDEDAELEREYVLGLQKLALESINSHEFDKAGDALEEALKEQSMWDPEKTEQDGDISPRNLKIQLAACYFFQGNWKSAECIVLELASLKRDRDVVICNLLHALALGYLSEYSFEKALKTCQQSLQGKKKLFKEQKTSDCSLDYNASLGLLATIFDMADDYIRAEVLRRQLPLDFSYDHPRNAGEYLTRHEKFISTAFPTDTPDLSLTGRTVSLSSLAEAQQNEVDDVRQSALPQNRPQLRNRKLSSKLLSTLQVKSDQHRRLENDTNKEVSLRPPVLPSRLDTSSSELNSPASDDLPSPMRQRLTRLLSTMTLRGTEHTKCSDDDSISSSSSRRFPLIARWSVRLGHQIFGPKKSNKVLGKKPKMVSFPIKSSFYHKGTSKRQNLKVDTYADNSDKCGTYNGYYAPQTPLGKDGDFTVLGSSRDDDRTFDEPTQMQSDMVDSSTTERVPHVGMAPYSADSFGYSELHEDHIRELPNTSPLPELSQNPQSPISARTRRVHFAVHTRGAAAQRQHNEEHARRDVQEYPTAVAELDSGQFYRTSSTESWLKPTSQMLRGSTSTGYCETDTTRTTHEPDQTPSPVEYGFAHLVSAESCDSTSPRSLYCKVERKPLFVATCSSQRQAGEASSPHSLIRERHQHDGQQFRKEA